MTAAEEIKSNPYLNPNNCTDLADVESAMDSLRVLDEKYPNEKSILSSVWSKMLYKKAKFERKQFEHQLKSINNGDSVMFHAHGECFIGVVTSKSFRTTACGKKIKCLNVNVSGTTHQVTKIV
jgi:hypothetical protein